MKLFNNVSNWGRRAALLAIGAIAALPARADFTTAEAAFSRVSSGLKTTVTSIINVVSIILAVVGVVMLAWTYYRRTKGDGQSNDAMAGWLIAMVFVILGIQIIKLLFLQ